MKSLIAKSRWGSRLWLKVVLVALGSTMGGQVSAKELGKPNIVFILADDWGLGDVKCFGGDRCRIATPQMDALAGQGMKFTDAHSSSSVCTPTRYGILTGRYNWRSRLKSSVLYGFDSHLIDPKRSTVAGFLKGQGYITACVGKWHLGMDLPTRDGKKPFSRMTAKDHDKLLDPAKCNVDWKGTILNGPTSIGFDYFYGISASLDMPPYIWIHNDRFVGEATTAKAFHRSGPAHKDFVDTDVLPIITKKSCEFIASKAKGDVPFFLYVPLNSPHTPISPSKNFLGKSGLGKYADFVMETDWSIGQVVKAVDEAGLGENTLIIMTADNGCSPAARSRAGRNTLGLTFLGGEPQEIDSEKHYPSGIYRGHKADIFEGGHRVPFIARWTGKVAPGSECADPTYLIDLYAICAEILGAKPPESAAVDSVSMLSNLLGKADIPVREATIHHSINGTFSIRQGKWKLIFASDSGGWSEPKPGKGAKGLTHQLYDLTVDPGERKNLYREDHPVARKLATLMQKYIDDGRSTAGPVQTNEGETLLYPKKRKGK